MIKNRISYTEFSDWRFDVLKAKDSFIWKQNRKKLIDFTSGWNVINLGWNNSEITSALIEQAKKNVYAPMWSADPIQNKYAEALTNSLPKELYVVGRATGGTEANEEAIKTARSYTGRKKILGFKDSYHGQSFGTLALGYLPEYIESMEIAPLVGDFIQMDFPKVYGKKVDQKKILSEFGEKLDDLLSKKDVAAIVSEAGIITGWGTTYVAPDGYLSLVRRLTKKYGTILILDEVGTGFSRCGKLWGMHLENVIPDIATFAKGISNGAAAIGAMVTTKEIAEKTFWKSNLVSTFGWTPIACAASLKTLEIHLRDKIWEKSEKDGTYLLTKLREALGNSPIIEDINGIGLEIGVHFVKDGSKDQILKIFKLAEEKGLHLTGDNGDANIQLMPPLTIERDVLDKGLEIFISVVKSLR